MRMNKYKQWDINENKKYYFDYIVVSFCISFFYTSNSYNSVWIFKLLCYWSVMMNFYSPTKKLTGHVFQDFDRNHSWPLKRSLLNISKYQSDICVWWSLMKNLDFSSKINEHMFYHFWILTSPPHLIPKMPLIINIFIFDTSKRQSQTYVLLKFDDEFEFYIENNRIHISPFLIDTSLYP